jgi:hypothetical protein
MGRYAVPEYPVQEVNRAGRVYVGKRKSDLEELMRSVHVLNNWRASHAYPAQAFYMTVKRRATLVYPGAVAAQRLKRLQSISAKLMTREDMKLSQMQDIAGIRAVLPNVTHVRKLEDDLQGLRWKHEALTPKDYISSPKTSGYRGVHLKYRYKGEGDKAAYTGLKIEIQLRTELQHRWATAVEAADTFTGQALKASHGSDAWKRFFMLMASVYALREECPLVPGTPATFDDIVGELNALDDEHHFASRFHKFSDVFQTVESEKSAAYFLVKLDPLLGKVSVKGYLKTQSKEASDEYTRAEEESKGTPTNIVLVSVDSIAALKKVYPNYFMDTLDFVIDIYDALMGNLHRDEAES